MIPEFTLGVEEEYQIIDPVTRDLTLLNHSIVDEGNKLWPDQVKLEMHRAVVEVSTNICKNVNEVRQEVTKLRKTIVDVAAKQNLLIASAGTHPFAQWKDQAITDHPRYAQVVDELQDAARSNLIYGLHVHVGLPTRELCVYMMNSVRYFLPHIFALSTNSPFFDGRNTGFKSFRTKVFDKFPRTGIPDYFANTGEYDDYINMLVKTNCIDNGKKIWSDVRVHPFFPTVEVRICDVPLRIDETVAIAALIQAVVAKIWKLRQRNMNFRNYSRSLINENKWRASRWGINGKLVDFGREEEVNTKALIIELLFFIDEVIDDLHSRNELNYIHQILENGTGADRQLKVYNETCDLTKVVDFIVEETKIGI